MKLRKIYSLSFIIQQIVESFFFRIKSDKVSHLLLLVVVLRPIVSLGTQAYRWSALHGGLSKGSQPVFTRVSEKTIENSERLGRQARPGVEPGLIGVVSLVGIFLRNPSPYLREFRRKPQKTPNDQVKKRDQGLNLATPVSQFQALPLRHWWGFIQF